MVIRGRFSYRENQSWTVDQGPVSSYLSGVGDKFSVAEFALYSSLRHVYNHYLSIAVMLLPCVFLFRGLALHPTLFSSRGLRISHLSQPGRLTRFDMRPYQHGLQPS